MQVCLLSVVVLMTVASCAEAASLRFQAQRAIDRLCQGAQRRAVEAKELVTVTASETIFPQQTLLGRCDPDEDCCYGTSVRRAVGSETRSVTFIITNAVTNDKRHVTVDAEDHVKCECVDEEQVRLITNQIAESRR